MAAAHRDELLNAATSPEDREILARALDMGSAVLKTNRPRVTDFHDPFSCGLIMRAAASIPGLAAAADGGYPGAERARVVIYPDFWPVAELDAGLAFLAIRGNFRFGAAGHRDYLGALLGLGLRREKLGDIIAGEEGAQVVAAAEVAGYIRAELTRVGRVRVTVRQISREEVTPPPARGREIRVTVPSMRLDAVAAQGFQMSRSKMAREIAAGKIYLNWRPCQDPSAAVGPGDVISARGRGRLEIQQTGGKTRKDRIGLLLKRL